MKVIRNLIARLLRLPVMLSSAADGATALGVTMLLESCSEEGIAADAGSFGLCGTSIISD